MAHVQPFVAIVLGEGAQGDAEQLARAAGATAIMRPGQSHPVALHAPDAVIDLSAPDHESDAVAAAALDAVIDLSPVEAQTAVVDEVIDLADPGHTGLPEPAQLPDTAVVIDAAEVTDVPAMVDAVHRVLDGLKQLEVSSPLACVVASRQVTDTLKLVDDAGVLQGTADRDEHRWVSAPLAGPLSVLRAVASQSAAEPGAGPVVADRDSSGTVRPILELLIRHGVEVRAVPITGT